MIRSQVGGRRRVRRRVALLVGVLTALAAVFIPSAVGDPVATRYEVYSISVALKCNGTDPSVCQKIPGFVLPQLGQAAGHIDLFQNLDTGEKWGSNNITFHVHVVQGDLGPHAGATVQHATYFDSPGRPAWFIQPDGKLLGALAFTVNGTRCDEHGQVYHGEVNCTNPPAGPLVNQPTHLPATPGHYDWDAIFHGIVPKPDGVSIEINVTHRVVDPQK